MRCSDTGLGWGVGSNSEGSEVSLPDLETPSFHYWDVTFVHRVAVRSESIKILSFAV